LSRVFKTDQPYKFISYYQLALNTSFKESDVDDKRGIQFDEKGEFSTKNNKLEQAMSEFAKLPNNVEVK